VLHGDKVTLRGRLEEDVPILDAALFESVEAFSRASASAWRPLVLGSPSPFAQAEPAERVATFSVVAREGAALLGLATLWGIDVHNRCAHIGISLLPEHRGHGYGADTVDVLCRYGFSVLGLHRLQLETLSDNLAMLAVAERCGFVREGVLRERSWVAGEFLSNVVLALLAPEWDARRGRP
jgi:RimJ/RimL family protein N-acetyltransferase